MVFSITKYATDDIFIYSFVPKAGLKSIKKKGILSAAKLIEDPEALKAAKPTGRQQFISDIQEKLEDPEWKEIVSGVSGFFSLPDWSKIPDNHFIFKNDLVPIEINLSKLMREKPNTKLLGVELEKYNPKKEQKDREKYISLNEVAKIQAQKPSEIWKHYKGQTDKYAPDVPHLILIIDKVPSRYLII